MNPQVTYKPSEEVDFAIVGSGAAGGVLAKELSTAGFKVVVLEQGRWIPPSEFSHDEIKILQESQLTNNPKQQPQTFRRTPQDKAQKQLAVVYGRLVGGGSVHFTGNFWRFHEIDFVERSRRGRNCRHGVRGLAVDLRGDWSPITPRWNGRSVFPAKRVQAPSIRPGPSLIPCRPCR